MLLEAACLRGIEGTGTRSVPEPLRSLHNAVELGPFRIVLQLGEIGSLPSLCTSPSR